MDRILKSQNGAVLKVSCILTSYNRPNMVRQALKGISDQIHKDYELLVFDDSTILNIHEVVKEFKFQDVQVFHTDVPVEDRRRTNRLGINCNLGLSIAKGDLVCFACDDDYYYPDWFRSASAFFKGNKDKHAAFGILRYSKSQAMNFPTSGPTLFHKEAILNPACRLDHNQVMHRRFTPPFKWPEVSKMGDPDAVYFKEIAKAGHAFYPIEAHAVVKRQHAKNLQTTYRELGTPAGETARE